MWKTSGRSSYSEFASLRIGGCCSGLLQLLQPLLQPQLSTTILCFPVKHGWPASVFFCSASAGFHAATRRFYHLPSALWIYSSALWCRCVLNQSGCSRILSWSCSTPSCFSETWLAQPTPTPNPTLPLSCWGSLRDGCVHPETLILTGPPVDPGVSWRLTLSFLLSGLFFSSSSASVVTCVESLNLLQTYVTPSFFTSSMRERLFLSSRSVEGNKAGSTSSTCCSLHVLVVSQPSSSSVVLRRDVFHVISPPGTF